MLPLPVYLIYIYISFHLFVLPCFFFFFLILPHITNLILNWALLFFFFNGYDGVKATEGQKYLWERRTIERKKKERGKEEEKRNVVLVC